MKIRSQKDLDTYKIAFDSAMKIFEVSKSFPKEERFSLTDQVRRSSRSVCANLAEAFRKRKYPKHFVSKLSDCEGEAAESQVWLDFALECKYISKDMYTELMGKYNQVLGKLVNMSLHPEKWSY